MNIHTIWILALTEMRSCRRLIRSWLVIVIVLTVCIGWYLASIDSNLDPGPPYSWVHYGMNARYMIAGMMTTVVVAFSCGFILLAFDIRLRDVRDRIDAVVDSLPANNVEIIVGRLLGILLLLLIPVFGLISLVGCYELIAELCGVKYRVGIHPISVASLFVWDLLPHLVFFGAFVACLSTVVRNRMVIAFIGLGVLFGALWIEGYIPVFLRPSLSPYVASVLFPSDLTPIFVTPPIATSRIAILIGSIALLLGAATLLPRTEPRRKALAQLSVALTGIGALMFVGSLYLVHVPTYLKEQWTEYHRQHQLTTVPDVQHMVGHVDIQPGHLITLDITLTVATPSSNTAKSIVFSLNPGYEIKQVFVDGEQYSDFSFEAGLLTLSSDVFTDHLHEVQLLTTGRPDDRFAYLDQSRNFHTLADDNVPRLGLRNSIFHADYVALMPGIFWYPTAGVATDRDNLEAQPRDLFTFDLTITVPRKWKVAMAGERKTVVEQKQSSFQFDSDIPLPELALLAAEFEHRATTIHGIDFEVLFSKRHRKYLDELSKVTDQLHSWISSHINSAHAVSLQYPYETFSVVEVPSSLRIYGGGWQMGSVLQPPAMMLIRENTLPTVHFDSLVNGLARRRYDKLDGQYNVEFLALWKYVSDDMQGSNPFVGISRNYVSHQVSATGPGAPALQLLLDELTNQLIIGYDSCSIVSATEFGDYIRGSSWGLKWSEYRLANNAKENRINMTALPSTRHVMDRVALVDLDFRTDPISSFRVLYSKGHAIATSMIAYYGAEKIGTFLKKISTDFEGRGFTVDDFVEVASMVDIDLRDWVLPWLEDTMLPGYLVSSPTVSKTSKPDFGNAAYQTTLVIHNAEPASGLLRVVWSENGTRNFWYTQEELNYSDWIFFEEYRAKRIAIQSNSPLIGLRIEPVLALNRMPTDFLLPEGDESIAEHSSALPFVTEATWALPKTESIVVDDLDPTFNIVVRPDDSEDYSIILKQSHTSTRGAEIDHGLPVRSYPQTGEWHRLYHPTSYGRYRHTYARIARGDQSSAASFVANIPREGTWRLDFFVPQPVFYTPAFGGGIVFLGLTLRDTSSIGRPSNQRTPNEHYRLTINAGESSWKEIFDVANAKEGWNIVGFFDLSATEVEVLLSDYAGHKDVMVHADAIRWTPFPRATEIEESSQ